LRLFKTSQRLPGAQPIALLLFIAFFLPYAHADENPFTELQTRLTQDGLDPAYVAEVYKDPTVRFSSRDIKSNFIIKESKLNYGQFLSAGSVERCYDYMKTHKESLEYASNTYGVPEEIIVAILMVETRLGAYTGNRNVLNVLSSFAVCSDPAITRAIYNELSVREREEYPYERLQAYCARKSKWAYEELKAFLEYAKREGIPVQEVSGSISGAIGFPQFLPSNIGRYGRDGDGDGQIDLHTHPDAHASIAYYLRSHGWREGLTVEEQRKILFRYNRSDPYVNTILALAEAIKAP